MPAPLPLTAALLALAACGDGRPPAARPAAPRPAPTFQSTLKPTPIPHSKFAVGVPPGYFVKESEGPDFSVYYVQPTDSARKPGFTAGFYFGNHPSWFGPHGDSCGTGQLARPLLGRPAIWTTYTCRADLAAQAIVASGSGEGWSEKLHAFAGGATPAELDQALTILTTLQKQP